MFAVKRWIVAALESVCFVVDGLPDWTYPLIGRWIGCPTGLAFWSSGLDERWGTGHWGSVEGDW